MVRWSGERGEGECRKQIEIQQFGARNLLEGAVLSATVPVLPVNRGEDRSVRARYTVFRGVTEYRARHRGWDVAAGYATIEHRDEDHTMWGTTLPRRGIDVGLTFGLHELSHRRDPRTELRGKSLDAILKSFSFNAKNKNLEFFELKKSKDAIE